ncbi:MAG: hypothetical protein RI601_01785 [Desulfurivibrionaceae bacterium]|nr:hypothetical protein [Desulfurivibrionaceae bacterium]
MKKSMVYFAAGSLGGVVNGLAVWFFGAVGITGAVGVAIAPALTANFLYPRIVWGGLWGLLFLLPLKNMNIFTKGALLSLAPTAIQLFVVFPLKTHQGVAGLELGLATPLFALFVNWIWGVATAFAIKIAR